MTDIKNATIAAISDRLAHPDDHKPAAYWGLPVSDGQDLDAKLDSMTPQQQSQTLTDTLKH